MLKLNLSIGPKWLPLLPGVKIFANTPGSAIMIRARLSLAEMPKDASREDVALSLAKAVARACIRDWRGVLDEDGNPAPVTPDHVDALLDIYPAYEAFQEKVMLRAFALDAEKNDSAPSPNGTSTVAPITAQAAPAAAPSARKRSTSPKAKKAG